MENFIPTRPEFITKDWVLMIINQFRGIKNLSLLKTPDEIRNISCRSHPSSRGVFSTSYYITVDYSCLTSMGKEDICYNLYFKMGGLGAKAAEVAIEAQLMENEVETILKLFPRMIKMIEEKKAENELSLPLPEIVYGSYSSSGEGIIVAMDALEQGFTKPDFSGGIPLSTLVSTVEALAKIHATSAAFMGSVGQENFLHEFPHLENSFFQTDAVFKHINCILKDFSGFVRRIPGFFEQHQLLEHWRASAWNILSTSMNRMTSKSPLICLIHGNLSSENILVKDDSVIISSWATANLGSPLLDLAVLLLSSTSQEDRVKSTRNILETYHFTFCTVLGRLGLDHRTAFPSFTIDNLLEEYDRCLFPAFHQAILIMQSQISHLEALFPKVEGDQRHKVGEQMRNVGRRAVELVDEACLRTWKQAGSCQVESSSLTIKIPAKSQEVKG